MTAKDTILAAIEKHGADGLVNSDIECGCSKDDLEPCSGIDINECRLARREPAPDGSGFDPGDWYVPLEVE